MAAIFLISLFGIPLLWLLGIRPYCVSKKEGYHTGASYGQVMWIDWQNAKEMAKEKGDHGMVFVCHLFLFLHFLCLAGFLGMLSVGP